MENEHVSQELPDWEQIHSPFSSDIAKLIGDDDNPAVIKDDFFAEPSIFPPGAHEDLQITSPQDNHQDLQAPEPIPLSPPSDGGDGAGRWIRLRLGVLQTGIFQIACTIKKYVTCKVGLWSLAAVVVVAFLHSRVLIWWRRRVKLQSSNESLALRIAEKDKQINQLLHQIAQMNEMLQTRRRVPVVRVK